MQHSNVSSGVHSVGAINWLDWSEQCTEWTTLKLFHIVRPSWQLHIHITIQAFPLPFHNLELHFCVHSIPLFLFVLSRIIPAHIVTKYSLEATLIWWFLSPTGPVSSVFYDCNLMWIYDLFLTTCRPSQGARLHLRLKNTSTARQRKAKALQEFSLFTRHLILWYRGVETSFSLLGSFAPNDM
jgi:hypothetical protein